MDPDTGGVSMGKLILGAILAGVVLMVWGFVTWGLFANVVNVVKPVPNEAVVADAIRQNIPATGTYYIPWEGMEGSPEEKAAWEARHAAGPIVTLCVRKDGVSANMGPVMIKGFVHFVVSAFLAALLLRMAAPALPTWGKRVGLLTVAGVFGSVAMQMSPSIWWYAPWGFTLFNMVATVSGWILAALVLAKFVDAPAS
jgi:hypothetical protein